jgi:microcystin-dependent protein
MSQPYIGEIRMVGFNFAPVNWAFCDGQLLPISENDALFTLIGTTYGGDGVATFALPNLQGRIPIHMGTGPSLTSRVIGESSGSETVSLTTNQLPSHTHTPLAQSANGSLNTPQNGVWAGAPSSRYSANPAGVPMRNTLIGPTGGSQAHENLMPFVAINFIIALFGIFPPQA